MTSIGDRPFPYIYGNWSNHTVPPVLVLMSERERITHIKFNMSVVGITLGVLSTLLNITFLMFTLFLKNGNTPYHRLLQSMSIADAFASLTFIIIMWPKWPLSAIDVDDNYTLVQALPYVLRSTPWMFFTAYLLTLSCLTINQYIAVCKPWKYTEHLMKRTIRILLIVVWFISSLQMIVPLVVLVVLYYNDNKSMATRMLFVVSKIEMQVWMVVFLTSSLFNVLLDVLIYRRIRYLKHRRRSARMSNYESQNIRMKQEAFITVTLLLLASIFCRLPFPLMGSIYQNIYIQLSLETRELIHGILVLLLYINFFVDPIIYIFRMKDVRRINRSDLSRCLFCVHVESSQEPGLALTCTQTQPIRDQKVASHNQIVDSQFQKGDSQNSDSRLAEREIYRESVNDNIYSQVRNIPYVHGNTI